jgi:hypothetical protein
MPPALTDRSYGAPPAKLGPEYWSERAAQCRREAESTSDQQIKHVLRNMAMTYEQLARMASRGGDGKQAGGASPTIADRSDR